MKLVTLIVIALVLWLSGPVFAGGSRFVVRPGPAKSLDSGRFHGGHVIFGQPFHHHHQHFGHHGHLNHHLFIPHQHFIFPYLPHTVVINAPFFCLAHQVGFVSRVGLIDHISGTHKISLDHAAAICPDERGTCLFEGF